MREGGASATAQAAAAVRALESLHPKPMRLFEDRYARRFLQPQHRLLLLACRLGVVRHATEQLLDRRYPGIAADFVCRTRYIDQALQAALDDRLERLAIVGAGYDTRALRLVEENPAWAQVEMVELDHPATQHRKRRLLRGAKACARFVAHDLAEEPDASPEVARAFASRRRTAFVVEGLTGYLEAGAVEGLFAWMSRVSAPRSTVLFTYVHRGLVDGSLPVSGAARMKRYLERSEEPFRFGWAPGELAPFLARFGFELEESVSAAELAGRYLVPRDRRRATTPAFFCATARRSTAR